MSAYNGENLGSILEPFIFDRIFCILAGIEDNHKSLDVFEFRLNSTFGCIFSCPCASEKSTYNFISTLAPSCLIRSFLIIAGKEDSHKISNEFEFRPDSIMDCENWRNSVSTLVFSFLIGSSSVL